MRMLSVHMRSFSSIPSLLLITALAGLALSCSRAVNPNIERGSDYYFEDGHPELRISALGFLNEEDEAVISVAADVVQGSLIFREQEGVNRADIELEVRVVGIDGTSFSDSYTTQMSVDNRTGTYVTSQDVLQFTHEMTVEPGNYEVYITVYDQSSENSTTRMSETYIPDPHDDVVNLTAVQLLGVDLNSEQGYHPVTTYDVSTSIDSLRFVVQVTNNRSEDPLTVNSRLYKFEADDSPARPMSFNNYTPSSLPYKGIDYGSREVMEETRRVIEQPGSVVIEYRLERPDEGNYRFQVTTGGADSEELFKARDFSVKGENFPAIQTARELAEPLIYLMGEGDHKKMMEIEDPDSLKEAVDRFWLSNVGSMNQARHVISMYYERVEEANKQFTNFKEGWKTDMGMMYILFGPPWYVERRLNQMQWSYSYDGVIPATTTSLSGHGGSASSFLSTTTSSSGTRDTSTFNISRCSAGCQDRF